MIKIATVSTFDEALEKTLGAWEDSGCPSLVRFEGFDGVGKSGLARLFVDRAGGAHVEIDRFAKRPEVEKPYRDCIQQHEVDAAVSDAIKSKALVALDAVCLDEVAPMSQWGRGFVIYIKRLSFNNWDPIWHEGLHLEEDLPSHEIRRSLILYHQKALPHLSADLIVELPDSGHSMSPGKFSRDWCFDPPGAEHL